MSNTRFRLTIHCSWFVLCLLWLGAIPAWSEPESGTAAGQHFALAQPFTARFEILLDDDPMGHAKMRLMRIEDVPGRTDLMKYKVEFSSRANRGMAGLARYRSTEISSFVIQQGRLYPLNYHQVENMLFNNDDWKAAFNWNLGLVSVRNEDGAWESDMDRHAVDPLSLYLLLAGQAANGENSFNGALVGKRRLKRYDWRQLPGETVSGDCGEFEAVVYEGREQERDRIIRTWHAPDLHWFPVRVQKSRKDGNMLSIELSGLRWHGEQHPDCGELPEDEIEI